MTLPASPFLSGEACPEEAAEANHSPQAHASAADIYELLAVADVRFRLNVRDFMEALEEPPLFLRSAG